MDDSYVMKVIFREANDRDYNQVCEILLEDLEYHINLLPEIFEKTENPISEKDFNSILKNPNSAIIIAEYDNEIIGYIELYIEATSSNMPFLKNKSYSYIAEFIVKKEHRKQGLGRKLMEKAYNWSLSKGIREIMLEVYEKNEEAINFYRNIGFSTSKRKMSIELE